FFLRGFDRTFPGGARQRLRGHGHDAVEQVLDPEVADGGAEVHRSLLATQVLLTVEGLHRPEGQLGLVAELPQVLRVEPLVQLRIVDARYPADVSFPRIGPGLEEVDTVVDEGINALE